MTSRELLQLTGAHNYDLSKFCDYLDEDELTWSQVCERAGAPNPDIIAICVTLNAEAVAPGGSEEEEEVGSLPSRYFRSEYSSLTPVILAFEFRQGCTISFKLLGKALPHHKEHRVFTPSIRGVQASAKVCTMAA